MNPYLKPMRKFWVQVTSLVGKFSYNFREIDLNCNLKCTLSENREKSAKFL